MPHKKYRKIIKIGGSYGITLPKDWLRFFGLNTESKVLMISNGNIIIEPPQKQTDKAQGVKSFDG